eukprot:gene27028-2255_t
MPVKSRARSLSKSSSVITASALRVAFIHPDLGLGGAERLVVDAAVELVCHGHSVDVYTAFYNPDRCFEETRSGGFSVSVYGSWFPQNVFGRLFAVCAYIRCIICALFLALRCFISPSKYHYDVVFCDQVSAVVPVIKALLPRTKVLFYCHFPDMLLAQRQSLLQKLYRTPIDAVEQATTGMAGLVLVNSYFTQGVFAQTFSKLSGRGIKPDVLHPAVTIPTALELEAASIAWSQELDPELVSFAQAGPVLLSVNRFERKKGIGLAVEALHVMLLGGTPGGTAAGLRKLASEDFLERGTQGAAAARLIIAGGFDARLAENREHLEELKGQVRLLGLGARVRFMPSFTDRQRTLLLALATVVVYTPQNEHFGIVPLEAMAAGKPVVAVRSGGPKESVVHERTGLLCEPTAIEFATAFRELLAEGGKPAQRMGKAAKIHVEANFSRQAFGNKLDTYVKTMCGQE